MQRTLPALNFFCDLGGTVPAVLTEIGVCEGGSVPEVLTETGVCVGGNVPGEPRVTVVPVVPNVVPAAAHRFLQQHLDMRIISC